MSTYTFTVEGMHCASCGLLIDETLEDLPGVLRAATSVRAGRTVADLDDAVCGPEVVAAAISAAGYRARREEPCPPRQNSTHRHLRDGRG